jgi:hypothetical protein
MWAVGNRKQKVIYVHTNYVTFEGKISQLDETI